VDTPAPPGDGPRIAVSIDVSAIPSRPTGAGRYVVELVRALDAGGEVTLTLVSRRGDAGRWAAMARSARVTARVPSPRPMRLVYERAELGRTINRLRNPPIAVHHGPHYTLPGGLGRLGSVVTVHDLTFFDHPEWHERSKVTFFQRAIRRAVARADAIICVSSTTADRLQALLSPAAPIGVVPHGVDHDRFRPDADAAADWTLVEPLGLRPDTETITHLGTLEPRKGVVDLVQAFGLLAAGRPSAELVLAGLPGWGAAEVEAAVRQSSFRERIHLLGYVDDSAVPALLRRSAVVAYPSHEEGFGLPALEAMACGSLLVTTTGTAMAEFAGAAAWTVPPGDIAALAEALQAALSAPGPERARRREQGVGGAAGFSWAAAAVAHAEWYRTAAQLTSDRRASGGRSAAASARGRPESGGAAPVG
jgi:glycosyltransferase involved in cell wall biosynthesis